jgi:homoserine O-acetyltransferase
MHNREFNVVYDKYIMDEFEFENGCILNDVSVEYSLRGTAKYDDAGNITNAIVYCHGYDGSYSSIEDLFVLTKKGAAFDTDEYFIVSVTALGFPESCSPSSTCLNHNFPKYSINDRVNFKRQFLAEKLGIEKVHGILGRGIGGYDAYTWACEYPDEMDFIIVSTSSYRTNGYRYVLSKGIESMIDSTDDFYAGGYSESLSRIMVSLNMLVYSNYISKRTFQEMSNDEIDVMMEDFVDEGMFIDIYDFKFRNDAILEYDVEDKLGNIKAKALIISPKEEMYYSPEFDTLPLGELIPDSEIVLYDSQRDITGREDISIFADDLKSFMNQFR